MKTAFPSHVGSLSSAKQKKAFVERLRVESENRENSKFTVDDLTRIGKTMGLSVGDFNEFLERLNAENVFIMRGSKTYELITKRI